MKKSTILLCLLINSIAFGQQINNTTKDSKGTLMLLGRTDKKAFNTDDFSWFQDNYNQYFTNDKVVSRLKKPLTNYTIKAFYGSWCGDSKREIPKFYKVIDEVGFDTKKLSMIAVDKKPEAYKASPNGEEKGLNIHRVPTFIFYKNDKEIGRIVESPKQDFERDILTIINGKNYTPNYIVVERLHALMKVKTIKELQKEENNLVISFAEFTKGSRELNTYGYKLLKSKNTEKALFVFQLNTKMYPYKYPVYDSMGEAYFTIKNYKESLKNYNKVLQLKPNDANALSMIKKIKKVI